MNNPASPSSSDSSCGGRSVNEKKAWPPQDGDTKPFVVDDFNVPIDVDLTQIEFLSLDDPAFFFIYASDIEIHTALGVPGAPVGQGATPALSAAAFKAFVVAEFGAVVNMNVCGVARLPPAAGNSDSAFQRLSNAEATTLTNRSIFYHLQWVASVDNTVGASTGIVYEMTPSPGGAAGGGRSPQAQQTRRLIYFVPP